MLQKDLVINEFYKGIADSPHLGIEDMRNLGIVSTPGAASINFKTSALNQPPVVSAVAYTAATNDMLTVASTTNFYNGMAVVLNTVVTAVGISTGRVYWIGDLTATTFKLYKNPSLAAGGLVDITTGGTGTFTSYTMSAPLDRTVFYSGTGSFLRNYVFILDDTGKVWWVKNTGGTLTNNLVYLGNDTLTGTGGRAITIFKNYLIVFRESTMDALSITLVESSAGTDLDGVNGWHYGWESISSISQTRRAVLVGQDGIMYYNNNERLGSISEIAGDSFDPTDGVSYNESTTALDLPADDDVISLGELGTTLLIGGLRGYVYPWDRVSSSFDFPIILPENETTRIVTANQLAYLFTGNRGRIYITNGTSVELYKKIPDYISGTNEPYFSWNDAISWRNQLYLSFNAFKNDGTTLTATGGVWAIDLKTGAFRFTNQLSYGTGGIATVLLPNVLSTTPPGNALYVGWSNSLTYGVDVSATTYYTSYAAYSISPLFVVGTHKNKADTQEAAITLEEPLASGEGVRISYRKNRSAAWSTPVTFDYATYGALQTAELPLVANELVTVQFKVELTGGTTTPKVQEVRIR